jgi:hypothetical protein
MIFFVHFSILILFLTIFGASDAFLFSTSNTKTFAGLPLHSLNSDKEEEKYKFGDLTRNFIRKVSKNDKYELGDAMRSIDKTIKESVAKASGKEEYQFGDLSRLLDKTIKDKANAFTGNEEYAVGDISKEILRRVASRDYTLEDIILLLKILLALGSGLSPVASFLPAKLLIELLDYSILGDLSNKIIEAASRELDRRLKKSITGDENYQLGDFSKKAIMKYIGKDTYSFGDITKKALEDKKANDAKQLLKDINSDLTRQELASWDAKFIEAQNSDSNNNIK